MRIATITATTVTRMDDFLYRATLGAAMLGAVAGPIGCFVLWRRLAYLGESVAHMGLLGVAIGLLMGVSPLLGVAVMAVVAALLMARADNGLIPAGSFVGIVGHAGLALGFILLATMETVRTDLLGYLFGDVLALSDMDLASIALAGAAVVLGTVFFWRAWLMMTVNADIARAEGRTNRLAEAAILVLVAMLVAVGLRVVGALLIVALIIVPPAAARPLARTPQGMALIAALIGAASAPLGVAASYWKDIPTGPSIVLAAIAIFVTTTLGARIADAARARA
ncbi:MAG TPA: metal ABC transporter permease [Rhizomicrobium sp.]|nr:metal ABC transporter permease [Rhizomicrobium sp.]